MLVAVRRRKCITCVGEGFGLFKKAIRPFGKRQRIERNTPERRKAP
jgi:hypothetical protein